MSDLWAALALVLVIEGLLPFAAPRLWREMLLQIATMDERRLRLFGGSSIAIGMLLLYWIRGS